MDRNLALELVRVTEASALFASRFLGKADAQAAHQSATVGMRKALSHLWFDGKIVLGLGDRGEQPALYDGEEVGCGESPEFDLIVEPLEGPRIVANGGTNAIAAISATKRGHFMSMPDLYMLKIAAGSAGQDAIDLKRPVEENLTAIAKQKGSMVQDLTVVMLKRERNAELMEKVRRCGARLKLIEDGDVSAAIATAFPESGVDVLIGIGGARQGVMTAAALKCVGGVMQGQLIVDSEEAKEKAIAAGVRDIERIYSVDDFVSSDVLFAATGVTDGDVLKGVLLTSDGAKTNSLVMRSKSGTIRAIDAFHKFSGTPTY